MKKLSKRELEAYCGDLTQKFGIRRCVLQEGKAKGIGSYQIWNGQGLRMTVLPDKCFAIPELSFGNVNVGFISKTGICAPEFYQEEGTRGFLRNFEAGFLTTCGLTYMGTPVTVNGQKNGLHGGLSNTPAEHTYARIVWENEKPWIEFGGRAREGYLFGPNMEIRRNFRISTETNKMWIHDEVENKDFERNPLMLLYHFNFGYPMLDESCKIYTNMNQIEVRDMVSEKGLDKIDEFQRPEAGYEEEVFFRRADNPGGRDGYVLLHNVHLNLAVILRFNPQQLPTLNHWRSPRSGDYAMGLEPGTAHVGGYIRAQEDGTLQYMEAGETRRFDLEVEWIDGERENEKLNAFINKISYKGGKKV